jgi:protoheme ferro-lyase
LVLLLVGGALFALFRYKNPAPQLREPNYYRYYQTQDPKPTGKVGILVTQLIMPEDYRPADYYNISQKSLQYIPWPLRNFAKADRGVVLLDAEKFYEFAPFEPTRLVDLHGGERDVDGVRFIDKYRRGEIKWVPPDPRQHLDHGYFLLTTRKQGIPTIAAKLMTKARVYYHGHGFVNKKLPHEAGMRAIVEGSMALVQQKYGPVPWRFVTADNFGMLHEAIASLLDEGIDTVLLAPAAPIYSHHEEFNGGVRHAMENIEAWERKHGKDIKVIITPQLGDFPVLRQAYLTMLKERLDSLPANAETDVKVAISVHGMPWDFVPKEAWLELAPAYRDAMQRDAEALLARYPFGRKQVVIAQDHFADPINNPKGRYLSTNQAFKDGIRDQYEYVINLPIEFFAENSDTMFSHAMFNFEGFAEFDRYAQVDYSDWSQPYTREFQIGVTRIVYNGLPVGRFNTPIVQAHFAAIDSILSRNPPVAPATGFDLTAAHP